MLLIIMLTPTINRFGHQSSCSKSGANRIMSPKKKPFPAFAVLAARISGPRFLPAHEASEDAGCFSVRSPYTSFSSDLGFFPRNVDWPPMRGSAPDRKGNRDPLRFPVVPRPRQPKPVSAAERTCCWLARSMGLTKFPDSPTPHALGNPHIYRPAAEKDRERRAANFPEICDRSRWLKLVP